MQDTNIEILSLSLSEIRSIIALSVEDDKSAYELSILSELPEDAADADPDADAAELAIDALSSEVLISRLIFFVLAGSL